MLRMSTDEIVSRSRLLDNEVKVGPTAPTVRLGCDLLKWLFICCISCTESVACPLKIQLHKSVRLRQ